MWGTLINGIQATGLEHVGMTKASWNGATSRQQIINSQISANITILPVGLLVAYTAGTYQDIILVRMLICLVIIQP